MEDTDSIQSKRALSIARHYKNMCTSFFSFFLPFFFPDLLSLLLLLLFVYLLLLFLFFWVGQAAGMILTLAVKCKSNLRPWEGGQQRQLHRQYKDKK